MEFTKLSSPSLRDLFVTRLEEMVLSEKLKIGEKLPTERVLAESMKVSRSVINSGISELERKGFLTVVPRVGTFVADYKRNGNMETLISMMNYNGGHIPEDAIRSILEVRIALSALAIRLLIPKISDDDIEGLGRLVEKIKEAKDPFEASDSTFVYLHSMVLLSGNTLIPLIFSSFKIPVRALGERFCTLYGIEKLYENTRLIWERIAARDADGAIKYLELTISDSIDGKTKIYY